MEDYLDAMNEDMAKAIEGLKKDLQKVRTGRASPQLVDGLSVLVHSYGATMPLNQLASVNAPDARLLVVTPWDKGTIPDIERAILSAGLGLNPSNDGKLIRLPIPPLTQDRRRDLTKLVRETGEAARVRVRAVRREYNEIFKQAEKDGDVNEDEAEKLLEKVQAATDTAVAKVDELVAAKEKEVLEV
jgi:ribosome recycling factor